MAAQRIPKCIELFLNSMVRVMQEAKNHSVTDQVDSAEFLCHRLNEYERT